MARKIKLDFTGVTAYQKCDEGIHVAKLVQIDAGTTQGGDDMLKATFEVTQGDCKGARVFDNFTLTEKALWKLKIFLTAIGVKSDGKIQLDLDRLVGKSVNIEVGHEEYNGQTRARILTYTALAGADIDDEEDDDEEEVVEKPEKKAEKKKEKKQPEPKDDDEDDWEDDEDWEEA